MYIVYKAPSSNPKCLLVTSLKVAIYLLKLMMSVCGNIAQKHHMDSHSKCSGYRATAQGKCGKVYIGVIAYLVMAVLLDIYASKIPKGKIQCKDIHL